MFCECTEYNSGLHYLSNPSVGWSQPAAAHQLWALPTTCSIVHGTVPIIVFSGLVLITKEAGHNGGNFSRSVESQSHQRLLSAQVPSAGSFKLCVLTELKQLWGGGGGGWTHHLRNEMVTMYQRFPKYSVNRRMGVGGTLSSHPWFNQNYRTFIWSVYLVRRKMSATQSKKKVVKTTGLVDLWGL